MKRFIIAAAALTALVSCQQKTDLSAPCPTVEPVVSEVIFAAGDGGYDMFARPRIVIPHYKEGSADAAAHVPQGVRPPEYLTVRAFAQGYIAGKHNPVERTVMRTSTDGGQSWGPLETVTADRLPELLGEDYVPMGRKGKTLDYLSNGHPAGWQLRLLTGSGSRLQIGDGGTWTDISTTGCTSDGDFAIFYESSVAVLSDDGEGDVSFAVYPSWIFPEAVRQAPDEVVLLYPQGQEVDRGITEDGVQITLGPGWSNGLKGPEVHTTTGNIRNVGDSARIEIYLPREVTSGKMVVICPGGGYANLAARKEGTSVAQWLCRHGVAAAVLIYRMPERTPQIVLRDVHNAMRYLRHRAPQWGVQEVGILGFSAGGHLCAYASTFYRDSITRPDFSIPFYAVLDLDGNKGTRNHLIGEDAPQELVQYYSLQNRVAADNPRSLLILSADDRTVPYPGSVKYFEAQQAAGVESQMLMLPCGRHGWGFIDEEPGSFDRLGQYRSVVHAALLAFLGAQ